jgi:sarcosine oxidase subunit gamma
MVGVELPMVPGRSNQYNDRVALWLGPDEWLVLAPAATGWPDWEGERGAAIDIGDRQVGLRIAGRGAADALAVACPLDLAPKACPVGFCTRTVFGKAEIVLWRREADVFHLEVWRSFAGYVLALLEAGVRDLG